MIGVSWFRVYRLHSLENAVGAVKEVVKANTCDIGDGISQGRGRQQRFESSLGQVTYLPPSSKGPIRLRHSLDLWIYGFDQLISYEIEESRLECS
jgi:hypothetical protein